jgi:NOL1/NOP2/sun family putative RNA methylase
MSGKVFFKNRYSRLGWAFKDTGPRQAIRVNRTRVRDCDLLERLKEDGVALEQIPFLENGFWVKGSTVSVGATAEYLLGLYSIQEAAAQIPATLFSNVRGKLILDACAAPGGKTVQLADLMDNNGTIIALDVSKERMTALANHLERCRVSNTVVYKQDARTASNLNLKFDGILLDVPCSGNFVSDNNWFRRRTLQDVKRNAALQKAILTEAVSCLADNGEIVYSTCSLEPEENEMNMDWAIRHLNLEIVAVDCKGEGGLTQVLGQSLDASIKKCKRIWPGETQGFFVCKLGRRRK